MSIRKVKIYFLFKQFGNVITKLEEEPVAREITFICMSTFVLLRQL